MELSNLNNIALSSLTNAVTPTEQVISLKMLDNQLEATETLNASMIQMMELSVAPAIGGNLDLKI